MGETKVLLAALADAMSEGPQPLVTLFQGRGSKTSKFDIVIAMDGLTKATDRQELSDRLAYLTSEVFDQDESDEVEQSETAGEEVRKNRRQVIGVAAVIVKAFLQHEDWIAPSTLFDVVRRLHGEIFATSDTPSLQNELCELCELWYLQERSGREEVAPQMITYLLAKSLAADCKIVDIKRLNTVRMALELIDWDDDNSVQLRILIQRTFLHHTFLTSVDGKKFLVWALSTLPLIAVLHKTIKSSIVSAPKWKLSIYAQTYFKAWQKAQGIQKLRLENHALQNLIEASLHCQNATVLKNVKSILKHLVDQKASDKNVEELLHRLYSPVLFRALQVANPHVRENALYQLGMVFPLVPPTLPQGEFDEALQDQVHLLIDALEDPIPKVRAQAVLSVGRILALFWEILPSQSLHSIVSHLVNEVALDRTSPSVREAVFKAMTALLDNPMSHRMLKDKSYLARLSPLIFDTTDRVRLACASLLEHCKKTKMIKFYEVVDLERILDAMANDSSLKVQAALSRVLLPSYWPLGRYPVEEFVTRAKDMITINPTAAVVFFSTANLSDPNIAAQFIVQLWEGVVRPAAAELIKKEAKLKEGETNPNSKKGAVKRTSSKTKSSAKASATTKGDSDHEEDKDNIEEPEAKRYKTLDDAFIASPENVSATVKVVAAIWYQIDGKLKDLEQIQDLLSVFKDEELVVLHRHFPISAITSIAARLPPSGSVRVFAQGILDTVSNPKLANPNGTLSEAQSTSLTCIFAWESAHLSRFMDVLHKHLTMGSNAHRQHAMRLIQSCISGPDWMCQALLNQSLLGDKIFPALKEFQFELESRLNGSDSDISDSVMVEGLILRMRILVHSSLTASSVDEEFAELSKWTQSKVIPYLQSHTRANELDLEVEEDSPSEVSFALRLLGSVLLILNDYEMLLSNPSGTRVNLGLWKLTGEALKVRGDVRFLRLATAVGWKLAGRRIGHLQSKSSPESLNNDQGMSLTSMVLLLILRDQSTGRKLSVNSVRDLAKPDLVQACLDHVWNLVSDQLPPDNFEHELDLTEGIPAEIDTLMVAFSGTSQMVSTLAQWIRTKIRASSTSPASVWTAIQILALSLRPVKRMSIPSLNPIKLLITHLFGAMKEADETESVLRSRLAQLLKAPNFSSKSTTKTSSTVFSSNKSEPETTETQ